MGERLLRRSAKVTLDDLKAASELVAIEDKIASDRETIKRSLGSFYGGEDPDFEGAERAVETAEKALKIAGRARAPKALRDNLCAGTKPSKELSLVGRKVRGSISSWRSDTRKLRGLLPMRRVPTTGKPMQRSAFKDLASWAHDLCERLESLSRISAEALVTRTSLAKKCEK